MLKKVKVFILKYYGILCHGGRAIYVSNECFLILQSEEQLHRHLEQVI